MNAAHRPTRRGSRVEQSTRLSLDIGSQPDDTTCGPTCLHAIYQFYGLELSLERVISATRRLDHGGTLDVFLALDALSRGFDCTIYPYNMALFDPTWFDGSPSTVRDSLAARLERPAEPDTHMAILAYLEFIDRGGHLAYRDLTSSLIRSTLKAGTPILTGLNCNYLYRSPRENPITNESDPIHGLPCGHFVVLYGYDRGDRHVLVADPFRGNPLDPGQSYRVGVERLIGAILLGALTFDANLLVIAPRGDD
jgi:hypothetical protein